MHAYGKASLVSGLPGVVGGLGFTWTTKVCKIMAFLAVILAWGYYFTYVWGPGTSWGLGRFRVSAAVPRILLGSERRCSCAHKGLSPNKNPYQKTIANPKRNYIGGYIPYILYNPYKPYGSHVLFHYPYITPILNSM